MFAWLSKAKKPKPTPAPKVAKDEPAPEMDDGKNEHIQGSYTDHEMSPIRKRLALRPMGDEEEKAFHWIMKKLDKMYPKHSYTELIDEGFNHEFFILGKDGELVVNPQASI